MSASTIAGTATAGPFAKRIAAAIWRTAAFRLRFPGWLRMSADSCRSCYDKQSATDGWSAHPAIASFSRLGRLPHCTARHSHSGLGRPLHQCIPLRQSPRRALLRTLLRRTARRLLLGFRPSSAFAFVLVNAVTNLSQSRLAS